MEERDGADHERSEARTASGSAGGSRHALGAGPRGVRTFVAVPLPRALRETLMASSRALAVNGPAVRWVRKEENLHLTLAFLGQVPEAELPRLAAALTHATSTVRAFPLRARGLGAFPSPHRASVIWAGLDDPQGDLAALAHLVAGATSPFRRGPAAPARAFHGHVTLGRASRRCDARALLEHAPAFSPAPWLVSELHVYESQLGRGPGDRGSTYVLRAAIPLRT